MNPIELIDAYYPEDNERKHILLVHSRLVAEKALCIADRFIRNLTWIKTFYMKRVCFMILAFF